MGPLVGAIVGVVLIGLVAHINTGAIVGAIVAVRSSTRDAWVYAAGMTTARVIQILLGAGAVLAILSGILGQLLLDRFIQLLLLLAGLVVLLGGIRDLRSLRDTPLKPTATESEPTTGDEPTDESSSTPAAFFWSSFALTILSPRQWLFSSLAVSAIAAAALEVAANIALIALYLAVSAWITIGLAIARSVRPKQADELIERVNRWVDMHIDRILAWGQLVIGVALMGLGVWLLVS